MADETEAKQSCWALPTTTKGCGSLAFWLMVLLDLAVIALIGSLTPLFVWAMLLSFPFCAGWFAALLYSYQEWRSPRECMSASVRSVAPLYKVLFVLAILLLPMLGMYILNIVYLEFAIYSTVAVPFAIGLASMGGCAGYLVQAAGWRHFG